MEARQRLEQVSQLEGSDPVLSARAFEALGGVAYWQGDFSRARSAYQSALDRYRDAGTDSDVANALYNLSFAYGFAGDYETGGRLLDQAHELYTAIDDETGLGHIAWGLGNKHHIGGDLEKARELFTDSAHKLHDSEDHYSYGWAVDRLGVVLSALGEVDEARARLTEALDLFTITDDVAATTIIFNDHALRSGDVERALRIAGIVAVLRARSGADLVAASAVNEVEGLPEAAEAVGLDRAEQLRAEGRAMSSAQALEYVRGQN